MKQVALNFRDVRTDGNPKESMAVVCVVPYEGIGYGVYDVDYSAKHQQYCNDDKHEARENDAFSEVRYWIPSAEFDAALSEAENG